MLCCLDLECGGEKAKGRGMLYLFTNGEALIFSQAFLGGEWDMHGI